MLLEQASDVLAWPSPETIRNPPGDGTRAYADLAARKIGHSLTRLGGVGNVKVGVLFRNAYSTDTETPISVVVEFQHKISEATQRELHRLGWNFSHSPSVITIEPGLLRVFTCCEPPDDSKPIDYYVVEEVEEKELRAKNALQLRAVQALHWVNLVSGSFFTSRKERFERSQRADQTLLRNLRYVRWRLLEAGVTDDDICHDLLARVIFTQYLFDRKDASGRAALDSDRLRALRYEGVLSNDYSDFGALLESYEDTYSLFDWLNSKFNGDLFPGKGAGPDQRRAGWARERSVVTPEHLRLLAEFVRGDMIMPEGQRCLWPQYAFDVIPLEFISSIYEEFVSSRASREGIYYTPPHLVDFVLDRVLPWSGLDWDLRILDPACGSGIFLVKAFQRLVYRWRRSGSTVPAAETLRRLLEHNLVGVDKDPHAIRVAAFSLYLALCDEMNPTEYWEKIQLPPMRDKQLITSDFFAEGRSRLDSVKDAGSYDIVVGNAPWGEKLVSNYAKPWARSQADAWPMPNKGYGTLFLAKSAKLVKPEGRVAMIQSAGSLLFNRSGPALNLRRHFFSTFLVEEVVNLSALRFQVFNRDNNPLSVGSVAPVCVVVFRPRVPVGNELIEYMSPKQSPVVDDQEIVIDASDVKIISIADAATDPEIWSALMWGSSRDWRLIRRLRGATSLADWEKAGRVRLQEGIIRGGPSRQREHEWLLDRPLVDSREFPGSSPVLLHAAVLPRCKDPMAERPRSPRAFSLPQLIVKQSWSVRSSRFQARVVVPDESGVGVVCSQSYLSVCANEGEELLLEAACLSINSLLAVYYLLLTSGRFASYRPEPLAGELARIPVPAPRAGLLDGLETVGEIDLRLREIFELKSAEWVLIEDMLDYALEEFKRGSGARGWKRTRRRSENLEEPDLRPYCEHFVRVLQAGFGLDKVIRATIFQEARGVLPYRIVAFELEGERAEVAVQRITVPRLLGELARLNTREYSERTSSDRLYSQRTARIYDAVSGSPVIFVVKPDAQRYWTRSMGLQDGDEVAADFLAWQQVSSAV